GPLGEHMRNLGLSRLLQIAVVLPLLALAAFGSVLVLDTLTAYREIERLAALEQLVTAASRLTIQRLNQESGVTQAFVASGTEDQRAGMKLARQRSDEAVLAFKEAAASSGLTDPKALGLVQDIERRLGG